MTFDVETARAQLSLFAPWVRDLNLTIEAVSEAQAVLRMPFSEHLTRSDGVVCGQALMTLIDTCSVFACWGAMGEARNVTTVDQNTSFLRPVIGKSVLAEGRVRRVGKTMAFPEVHLRTEEDNKLVAHGTATFAVLPGTIRG